MNTLHVWYLCFVAARIARTNHFNCDGCQKLLRAASEITLHTEAGHGVEGEGA